MCLIIYRRIALKDRLVYPACAKKILLCPESVRVFIIQQKRVVLYRALLLCK